MTYVVLCAAFLAVAVAAAVALSARRRPRLSAVALAAAALVVLTAVFDSVMIAVGLFAYDDERISGLRIGLAPLEDFAYPLAAAILLPALWVALRRRRDDP
ncbi:lycopene cyclase domain-containing protein [Microbacterium sp. JZ101]